MDFIENLSLQLTEVEMLASMFPSKGEFKLDDQASIIILKDFVEGSVQYDNKSPRIGFTLKLDSPETKMPLQLAAQLPHEYPQCTPEVFIRCETLTKSQHRKINSDLLLYVKDEIERGELCMCYISQWIQDNVELYIQSSKKEIQCQQKQQGSTSDKKVHRTHKNDDTFSRMWIYSHHIYSKIKRKDILEFATELNLTGFSMPGKPGIIAIEGYNNCVEEFWYRIRRMQWKRIVMKEKEDFKIEGDKPVDSYRVFTGFEEKSFDHRHSKGRGAHGDRGLLFQFLDERGCGHVFQYYFGVEGRPAENDSDG